MLVILVVLVMLVALLMLVVLVMLVGCVMLVGLVTLTEHSLWPFWSLFEGEGDTHSIFQMVIHSASPLDVSRGGLYMFVHKEKSSMSIKF